ncbi:hypothetical protein [Ferruginibacter sp.]|jgi:hypothetical protein|uniref:hypothetical protein n=1 Tax=Ferruginibacter sp. TaxID=1940288 RepID=UPI002657C57A|nr:hypothetical protein [Ferruginibacter sp.]
MRKITILFLLPVISIVLWGCPYDSAYGIDETALENIDENLLGSWATFVSKPTYDQQHVEDPVKIIFSKNTDLEYNIAITGYIDELKPYHVITNDTIKGTAYISTVSGKQFLNSFIKGRMYIAEIKRDKNNISILCLAESFTVKFIKNSKELRKEIEFYYKVAATPRYDDFFVAKNLQKVN